jgi:drug/metabolite transporter (DMT)-like permease
VLLRKWQPPLPQKALTGWMMLVGWIPLAVLAPFSTESRFVRPPHRVGSRSSTTYSSLARSRTRRGTRSLARFLSPCHRCRRSRADRWRLLRMLLLGERPGPSEWAALALVVAAMVAVLWVPRRSPPRRRSDS